MMRKLVTLVLMLVAGGVLAKTNPNEEAHRQVIYQKVSTDVGMKGVVGQVAQRVMDDLNVMRLTYHNYLLFSTATYRDKVVSYGFLSTVSLTDWGRTARQSPGGVAGG